MSPASKKLVIFDFDGTLCNSFPTFVEVLNELAPIFRYQRVDDRPENHKLRDLTVKEIMTHLGIARWKLPFIVFAARRRMLGRQDQFSLFPESKKSITSLENEGCKIAILSSNGKRLITKKLEEQSIEIDIIEGSSKVFSKHKRLEDLINKFSKSIARQNICYVGDEIRDIEAALRIGITPIAVSWGYQSPAVLKKTFPEHVVESWAELTDKVLST